MRGKRGRERSLGMGREEGRADKLFGVLLASASVCTIGNILSTMLSILWM